MSHPEHTMVPAAAAPPIPLALAADAPPDPARFRIRDIDWNAYRKIADGLGEHHNYRLSYDGKDLELMTRSFAHGFYARFFSFMIQIITQETERTLSSCGDMTCERPDVQRAIEPDECFYIENEPRVRGKAAIDLTVDPPPDLGLEIDLTTDSRRRMDIYAALRIPEVWRYDGRSQEVTIALLQPDGQYAPAERSHCLPIISAADLTSFVRRRAEEENSLVKAFRAWVREQISKVP